MMRYSKFNSWEDVVESFEGNYLTEKFKNFYVDFLKDIETETDVEVNIDVSSIFLALGFSILEKNIEELDYHGNHYVGRLNNEQKNKDLYLVLRKKRNE